MGKRDGEVGDGGVMTGWERTTLGMEATMEIGTRGPTMGPKGKNRGMGNASCGEHRDVKGTRNDY